MKRLFVVWAMLAIAWPTRLLTAFIVLGLAQGAWGQTYDTIGHTTANDNLYLGQDTAMWIIKDTANVVYTAGANDSIGVVKFWSEGVTSAAIALYRWRQSADTPTTRYWIDTMSHTASSAWDSVVLSPKIALEPDSSYCMGYSAVAGTSWYMKRQTGPVNSIGQDLTSPAGLGANYSASDETYSGLAAIWARVYQYPAGGSDAALVIGGNTVIGGNVVVGGK